MFNFSRENTNTIARWWRKIDKQLLFSFVFLFFLGLFFSFSSTSSVIGEKLNKETYFFFIKHLIFVILSLSLLLIISIQSRNFIENNLLFIFIISIIFLLLVPIIGIEVKGSKRWIDLPFLPRFQPIEMVKPLVILIFAKIIVKKDNYNIYFRFLISFMVLLPIIFLLINQPDIGQALLIASSWFIMIFVSGISLLVLFLIVTTGLGTLFLLIYSFPNKFGYIISRLTTFFDPTKGDNFQADKALDAIKLGGLTGRGMGEGILKDRVPEAHTDYIVAVISEEFGIIAIFLIILLFLYVAKKVLDKILIEEDEFIKLVLVGLISILFIQTFVHIGVNIRLFPTTGMTLPFLSYGGSSLIGSALTAGIILSYTKKILKKFN
ncbi:MAG: cell division protein FtsW [Candidatus Pelagibacter sp. TMED64]|nr:cell division protein FtsW [Candidatus Pelagibacter sp.]OUU65877.1 MAG: cell division protein FtsW [Candidatus Pelagibacter sp. TMED64]